MEKVVKKGLTVTKVLVYNHKDHDTNYDLFECELTFNDGSQLNYECDYVDELENENRGIYELLDDGTYIMIEDWD
jgi:hypothetical protein